jgi:predicted phosphodiesterase
MLEIFLSDIHFPFQDRAAWGLTLEVIKDLKPDLVFLGGDILDCYAVSKYDREPDRKLTLQQDLNYAYEEFTKIRKAVGKTAEIVYLEGNHEQRLTKFLRSKAEELSVLEALELKSLLKLNSLGIKWIPNGTRTRIGKLWHLHGNEIGGGGANIAKAKFDRLGTNIIFGHHHKIQSYTKRNYEGEVCGAWANGCLSDLQPDYAHFTDWILGFSIIDYSATGNFNVDQVPIIKPSVNSPMASCFIRGKEYFFEAGKTDPNRSAPYAEKRPLKYEGLIEEIDL